MGIDSIIGTSSLGIIALLSIIQISPLKINPWSAMGRMFNKDILDKVSDIQVDVKKLEKNAVDQSRARILRFADDIRHDIDHSQEYFDHILDDITDYEHYCESHSEYRNEKAVASIRVIRKKYDDCIDQNNQYDNFL